MNAIPTDYSTLRLDRLHSLPVYTGKCRASTHMGSGCFLDPPGFPSYFLQHLYNTHGYTPVNVPQAVIYSPQGNPHIVLPSDRQTWGTPGMTWEKCQTQRERALRRLWVPMPLEHPRTQAWISTLFGYFRNCWIDQAKGSRNASDLLITHATQDNPLGIPSGYHLHEHAAAAMIRDYYSDFQPTEEDLRRNEYGKSSWWETSAAPTTD